MPLCFSTARARSHPLSHLAALYSTLSVYRFFSCGPVVGFYDDAVPEAHHPRPDSHGRLLRVPPGINLFISLSLYLSRSFPSPFS
jgi:hypothetical protein